MRQRTAHKGNVLQPGETDIGHVLSAATHQPIIFLPRQPRADALSGARLPRKEDDRLMRGRGQYVADIRLSGLQDVAFVRSPLAHARIRGIAVPERYRGCVFTAADLAGVRPIRAVSALPGFKISEQPVLATGKVRQVGELIAM